MILSWTKRNLNKHWQKHVEKDSHIEFVLWDLWLGWKPYKNVHLENWNLLGVYCYLFRHWSHPKMGTNHWKKNRNVIFHDDLVTIERFQEWGCFFFFTFHVEIYSVWRIWRQFQKLRRGLNSNHTYDLFWLFHIQIISDIDNLRRQLSKTEMSI